MRDQPKPYSLYRSRLARCVLKYNYVYILMAAPLQLGVEGIGVSRRHSWAADDTAQRRIRRALTIGGDLVVGLGCFRRVRLHCRCPTL